MVDKQTKTSSRLDFILVCKNLRVGSFYYQISPARYDSTRQRILCSVDAIDESIPVGDNSRLLLVQPDLALFSVTAFYAIIAAVCF